MSEKPTEKDKRLAAFEERMKKKKATEDAAEKAAAEKLQQDYLHRTGRTEFKP